jgi:hypothetical protein
MTTPPEIPQKKSPIMAILITLMCGVFLVGGSCFGLLVGWGSTNRIFMVFGLGFQLGLIVLLLGMVSAIVWVIAQFIGALSRWPN